MIAAGNVFLLRGLCVTPILPLLLSTHNLKVSKTVFTPSKIVEEINEIRETAKIKINYFLYGSATKWGGGKGLPLRKTFFIKKRVPTATKLEGWMEVRPLMALPFRK